MGENRPEDTLLGGIQKRHLSPGASRGHLGEIKMLSGYWIQIQKRNSNSNTLTEVLLIAHKYKYKHKYKHKHKYK